MSKANKKKKGIDFTQLERFLTDIVTPSELAVLLETAMHNYSICLIENPSVQSHEKSCDQLDQIRRLRRILEKM